MAARVSAAEFGGPYQPAAVQSIADGIGIYPKHPANAVARAKLGEFLPLIGTGEMSAETERGWRGIVAQRFQRVVTISGGKIDFNIAVMHLM